MWEEGWRRQYALIFGFGPHLVLEGWTAWPHLASLVTNQYTSIIMKKVNTNNTYTLAMCQKLFYSVHMILETFRPNPFQCLFKTRLKWFKWEERLPKRHCSGAGTEWQSRFYQLRTYPQHRTFITFSAKQTVLSLKKTPQSLSKYSGVGTIECAAKELNLNFDIVFIIPLQKHLIFTPAFPFECCIYLLLEETFCFKDLVSSMERKIILMISFKSSVYRV